MSKINVNIKKEVFNDIYFPYLENEDKYLIFYGGGSSGKSYFIAQRYIYKLLTKKCNILVVRNTGSTNKDTTFAQMKQIINQWNLGSLFDVTELRIKCQNGNEVIFRGLDDPEKVKSTTFESGELTDVWVEEATECEEDAINQLKVRLRGGTSKKQMVLSFNPVNISHWIKRHFIDSGLATVCFSTYKDNKFLSEEDKKTLEEFKDTDEYYYNVYCLGQWGTLGQSYFDSKKINERILQLKEKIPERTGYFIYNIEGNEITDYEFIDDDNGFITIFKDVEEGTPYVIGGDTAGSGIDYFIGQVLNNVTGKQVAIFRTQTDEDEYARQMYCLGMYYNEALIGIENNYSTYPTKKLVEYGYYNMFIREREDTIADSFEEKYGFMTTKTTRPVILSMLKEITRDNIELINDITTLEEMLTFVRNQKGRPEAQYGAHDDTVMALAIAYYIREQQRFTVIKKENKEKFELPFELQDVEVEESNSLINW